MNKLTAYIKESYDELVNHVTWPNMSELQATTGVVLVASLIISLLIYFMDVASLFFLKTLIYQI